MEKGTAKPGRLLERTKGSADYSRRARRSLPGGVTAGVKYFDPYPIAMRRAKGCRLWDVDGNVYVDYCLSFGPLILGHGHPRVIRAIRESLRTTGTTMFGTPHELEAIYAERLLEIFRPDGKMRFTMSGTEATVHAVRLARAYRGRPMIAKFEGHYHGGVDELLVSHSPRESDTQSRFVPISGSRGTPEHVLKNTLVLPFNDLAETEARIRREADRLACVILEPVERSFIAPDIDFLKGVREVTAQFDIPLIFDEVMTGFRITFGGAQHAYGVTPDLTCLGKVIGGGLPCGAFLGRSDLLDIADPASEDFFHSSTFAGYPMAMAAGLATLQELERPGVFDGLLAKSRKIASGVSRALEDAGIPSQVPLVGTVFSVLFTDRRPKNYRDTMDADSEKRASFDRGLLDRGIFVKPGKPLYVSTAHDVAAIRDTLRAVEAVVPELA
jgi:glutamate-1-semialdehyde 2,1-aminomutase